MKCKNIFYYFLGLIILAIVKAKTILKGYTSPKTIPIKEHQHCIEYDFEVVEKWLKYLEEYTGSKNCLNEKNVLELGPGSDLGVGLYLISKGAHKYNAIDINNLTKNVPYIFYEKYFKVLKNRDNSANIEELEKQLEKTRQNNSERLNYVCRKDFNILEAFEKRSVDIVFSQAAFEHFDNIENTIKQLSEVVKDGALLIVLIDLKTHSKWIREKDPLNIYRYNRYLYSIFKYPGIPNRIRPFKYKELFEKYEWENISIICSEKAENEYYKNNARCLNKEFQDRKNQMEDLTVIICARKHNIKEYA